MLRSGPIFRLCKEMRPDFIFNVVQLNKFQHHRQCQHSVSSSGSSDAVLSIRTSSVSRARNDYKSDHTKQACGKASAQKQIFKREEWWEGEKAENEAGEGQNNHFLEKNSGIN